MVFVVTYSFADPVTDMLKIIQPIKLTDRRKEQNII